MSTVHEKSKLGFVEGSNYDRLRPSYSDALTNHAIQMMFKDSVDQEYKGSKYHVLELGAGTGKFTRKLLEKLPKDCKFMATDPSESFLVTLKERSPSVETTVCSASNIPLPDHSVRNIVCAQCFHWFANEASLQEMRRVLVPGGRLLFNSKNWISPWMSEISELLLKYSGNAPVARTYQWKTVIEEFKDFCFVEYKFLPGVEIQGTSEELVDLFATTSYIAALENEEKCSVKQRIYGVLEKYFTEDQRKKITVSCTSEFYCVANKSS